MTPHPIRCACDILFTPGEVVEVRAIGKWGTASGYFNDFDKLTASVRAIENTGEYAGIYITLNAVNPNLLARRANRIEKKLGKKDATTADDDIIRRFWLPVDIDPVRPSGVSSSDEEHTAAKLKAYHIADYLADLGWPEPVVADSGNGAHLLYRIDLPSDSLATALVKGVLETLDTLFSDALCHVDTANFNASRIWKLYGTTGRKGDDIPERPHRKAEILKVPDDLVQVSASQMEHLAGMIPKEQPKQTAKDRSKGESIVLSDWLLSHGIGHEEKSYSGGLLFMLDECPFSSAHKDGAYAIQFPNGAIFAGCHHDSCGGGSQRWSELRERFEGTVGDRLKRLKSERKKDQQSEDGSENRTVLDRPSGVTKVIRDEVKKESFRVLHEGDPLRYILDTFGNEHIGDQVVAECLAMSLASRQVINAKGLHVSVTGDSGKGKSHSFDTMMQQVPEDLRLEGRMSDKALFYIKEMKPGTVIALDDVSLSDQMQEILKGVTTSFKKPFKYRTVNKDRDGEICIIPERCVWWVAKVEGTGDDQVWNRMLTCWIDDSEEQDKKVLTLTLQEAAAVPTQAPGISRENLICQEMWRSLHPVYVIVPFAECIRFSSSMNRRNPDMLLDLVRAHASLMQYQRERHEAGKMICITATIEDFRQACRLYTKLNGESGGQQSKLTRKESELVDAIRSVGQSEITITEMQRITSWSHSVINKMLHGSLSKGYQYSGLLEKCPAISVCDRTIVTDEGGTSAAHRRAKAYSWDPHVYDTWASDGGCWLDGFDPDDGKDGDDLPPSDSLNTSGGMAERSGKIAENSAMKRAKNTGSDDEDLSNNNNFSNGSGKSESMKQVISDQLSACDCSTEIQFSAIRDPGTQPEEPTPADSGSKPECHGGKVENLSATRDDIPLRPRLSATSIQVNQFVEVDKGYGPGPCECCGYKWVNYQERFRNDRTFTGKKICKKCFERAKQVESQEYRPLPGILNIANMQRIHAEIGRCQICDIHKAVWQDREMRTAICASCYRIMQRGENGNSVSVY